MAHDFDFENVQTVRFETAGFETAGVLANGKHVWQQLTPAAAADSVEWDKTPPYDSDYSADEADWYTAVAKRKRTVDKTVYRFWRMKVATYRAFGMRNATVYYRGRVILKASVKA